MSSIAQLNTTLKEENIINDIQMFQFNTIRDETENSQPLHYYYFSTYFRSFQDRQENSCPISRPFRDRDESLV